MRLLNLISNEAGTRRVSKVCQFPRMDSSNLARQESDQQHTGERDGPSVQDSAGPDPAVRGDDSAESPSTRGTAPFLGKNADRFRLLDLPRELQIRISRYWSGYPLGLPAGALSRDLRALLGAPKDVARRAAAYFGYLDRALQGMVVVAGPNGDTAVVEALLALGADVNAVMLTLAPSRDGTRRAATTLSAATMLGNSAMVQILAERGLASESGLVGVPFAVTTASTTGSNDVMRYLLSLEFPKAVDADGGAMALVHALDDGDLDSVAALLDAGAKLNATFRGLHVLVSAFGVNNFPAALDLFLSHGTDINTRCSCTQVEGATLLELACGNGITQVARDLLDRGADAKLSDTLGRTPLLWEHGT